MYMIRQVIKVLLVLLSKTLMQMDLLGSLPPGMQLDSTTGEIAGRIPYQPAVTTEYKFTIEALRQLGSITCN